MKYLALKNGPWSVMLLGSVIFFSCQKMVDNVVGSDKEGIAATYAGINGNAFGTVSPEMVLRWNDAATYVVIRTMQLQSTPRIPPFRESHYYAMVNLAVHDALNNIVPRYECYAFKGRDKDASPDASVAQAAHDVIAYFFGRLNPPANVTPAEVQDSIHRLLANSLAGIPDSEAKTKGVALGAAAARAIIALRLGDGSGNAIFPITQGTLPGEYRSTPPFEASGFYDSPGWGNVTPFGLMSSTQFVVPPPYPLSSNAYATDYNEVKALGCNSCTGAGGRTPDQEAIAKFWVESSAFGWNKIALAIMAQKKVDAWKAARLLALVQMGVADAYISSLKWKMNHFFWRPYTAIRLGDIDGNPQTIANPAWQVLVTPIPPITDHPSAHATAGGAAAAVIGQFFGDDEIAFAFGSSSLAGSMRNYSSLSQAARENSLSRIYVGYHFRKACMDGETLGESIGQWVISHVIREK